MTSIRVLALLPGTPVPADTGGNLRALAMLRALDGAFDVTALCWRRAGDDVPALARMLAGRLQPIPHAGRAGTRVAAAVALALAPPAGYSRSGWFPPRLRRPRET